MNRLQALYQMAKGGADDIAKAIDPEAAMPAIKAMADVPVPVVAKPNQDIISQAKYLENHPVKNYWDGHTNTDEFYMDLEDFNNERNKAIDLLHSYNPQGMRRWENTTVSDLANANHTYNWVGDNVTDTLYHLDDIEMNMPHLAPNIKQYTAKVLGDITQGFPSHYEKPAIYKSLNELPEDRQPLFLQLLEDALTQSRTGDISVKDIELAAQQAMLL